MEVERGYKPPIETEESPTIEAAIPPYLRAAKTKFVEQYPHQEQTISTIISEITRQGHENWATFTSELYEGISFNFTKINLTKDFAQRVAGITSETISPHDNTPKGKADHIVILPGAAPPSDAHPFVAIDVVLDKVIRELPRIARAAKEGEAVPDIEIIMPSAPDAVGGHMTNKFLDAIDKEGFSPYGQLYAEFLQKTLPSDTAQNEKARIEFNGYSQGAPIASETIKHLSPDLRKKTQSLLDNPAGAHQPGLGTSVKGLQVAAGLGAEIIARTTGDSLTKNINKHASEFREYLAERHNLSTEDRDQTSLKLRAFASKSLWLMNGTPVDTNDFRHHIRESVKDPVSTGISRLLRNRKAQRDAKAKGFKRSQMAAQDNGKSFTALTDNGTHLWPYQQYDKWDRRISFVKNAFQTPPPPLQEAE